MLQSRTTPSAEQTPSGAYAHDDIMTTGHIAIHAITYCQHTYSSGNTYPRKELRLRADKLLANRPQRILPLQRAYSDSLNHRAMHRSTQPTGSFRHTMTAAAKGFLLVLV